MTIIPLRNFTYFTYFTYFGFTYIIAEFVENDAILHELIDLDVDYVQGYGVARPFLLSWH